MYPSGSFRSLLLATVCFFSLLPDSSAQFLEGKSLIELRRDSLLRSLPYPTAMSKVLLPQLSQPHTVKMIGPRQGGALIPEGYHYDRLGFFCKIEEDLARKTNFPIKVRLGEVQYVERMEGKKGYPSY